MPISSQLDLPPSKETAGITDVIWKLVYKPAVLMSRGNKLLIYKDDSGRRGAAVVRTVGLQQKGRGFDSCSGVSLICMFSQCFSIKSINTHTTLARLRPVWFPPPSRGALASSWRRILTSTASGPAAEADPGGGDVKFVTCF